MKRFVALMRTRGMHAAVLSGAFVLTGFLMAVQVVSEAPGQPYFLATVEQFTNWFLTALVAAAIISACEVLMRPTAWRIAVQAVLLAAGGFLYARYVGTADFLTVQYRRMGMEEGPSLFLYTLWLGWALAALMSWYYWARDAAVRAAATLRSAEIKRQRAQQRLLESRLQVLEAQVEPRFLLDTLSRLQSLYERDGENAERALDDLIDYLRAALPQLRESASTIARELGLVEAYVRVAAIGPQPLEVRIEGGTDELGSQYAPPMVLLPMVQAALAASSPTEAQRVSMRVELAQQSVCVHVEFGAQPGWHPASQTEAIGATLDMLFGPRGQLAVSISGARAVLSVSWPRIAAAADATRKAIPLKEE